MTDAIHPTRPAAIILLLRDGEDGLEVLCLQRSAQLGAFSGVLSFPGGKVSPPDADARLRAISDGAEPLDDKAFGHAIAAIREAFEEAGILLARRAGEADPIGDAWAASHMEERAALADGSLTMAAFAARAGIRPAVDRLTLFAHWITPEIERHRFDTWFFAAHVGEGHDPSHDGGEIVEGLWITPQAAIEEAAAGRRSLVFPTRLTLMRLAQFATAEAALAAARTWRIDPIMPVAREAEDGLYLCIPPEAGYPVSSLPWEVAAGKAPWRG